MTAEAKIIPQFKKDEVEALKELINKYDIICFASMKKLAAHQLQTIRKKLAQKIVIRMAKNRLFRIAALQSKKKNLKEFVDELQGSTTFIFTEMSPLKLQLFLNQNKVKAPAKAGDIAPNDIVVPEGNTGFAPGPMISEFKKVGIDTLVKQGTIHVKNTSVVVKRGEEITRMLALILSRMNINPLEIGLLLYAAYDNGIILKAETLEIDLEKTKAQIRIAMANALNLSIKIAYPTKDNIGFLLQKAIMNAKSLMRKAGIITKDSMPDLLATAYNSALAIANKILQVKPDVIPPDIKQKVEEKAVSTTKPSKKEKKGEKTEDKKEKKEKKKEKN